MRRIVYLLAFGLMVVLIGCGTQSETTTPATPTTSAPAAPTPKEQASTATQAFDKVGKEFDGVANMYQAELIGVGNRSISLATCYADLTKYRQQAMNIKVDIIGIDVAAQYATPKDTFMTSISYLESSIDELKTYMDGNKISDLSSSQSDLQQALTGRKLVTAAVAKQATADGYTQAK